MIRPGCPGRPAVDPDTAAGGATEPAAGASPDAAADAG